eukprot:1154382-Pelagomonas_calceolata.AAC.3
MHRPVPAMVQSSLACPTSHIIFTGLPQPCVNLHWPVPHHTSSSQACPRHGSIFIGLSHITHHLHRPAPGMVGLILAPVNARGGSSPAQIDVAPAQAKLTSRSQGIRTASTLRHHAGNKEKSEEMEGEESSRGVNWHILLGMLLPNFLSDHANHNYFKKNHQKMMNPGYSPGLRSHKKGPQLHPGTITCSQNQAPFTSMPRSRISEKQIEEGMADNLYQANPWVSLLHLFANDIHFVKGF